MVSGDTNLQRVVAGALPGSRDFDIRASFATATQAHQALPGLHVEIIVVDLSLPDLCGIQWVRQLKSRQPGLRAIPVLPGPDPVLLGHAISAGADTCLIRPFGPEQCLSALRLVASQPSRPVSPAGERQRLPIDRRSPPRLSEREQQVLGLLAEGFEHKHIEGRLGIKRSAVCKAQQSICKKLGAPNSTAAVASWLRLQLPRV